MVQIFEFAVLVVAVSASGVMAPGPLFAANVSYGLRGGTWTGLRMAAGHAVVELPLVILLGIGMFSLESLPGFQTVISILGATTLFAFAGIQIKGVLAKKSASSKPRHGPLITGIVFSVLNPFFIIWWFTVGFKLISDAMLEWAFAGMLIMFVLHIWMDFVWLGAVAFLAARGSKILSNRNYQILIICMSLVLVYFGVGFLLEVSL